MILRYRTLGVNHLNVQEINLEEESIVSFDVVNQATWNTPDLIIQFNDRIFRRPKGLILNYHQVVSYLKLKTKESNQLKF
jgi:hypothetical protein